MLELTEKEKTLVINIFQKVTLRSETTFKLMYKRLFQLAPETRPLFKNDMREQRSMFLQMIRLAVAQLNAPEKLEPILYELGQRHREYGVKTYYYGLMRDALLWALEQTLSPQDFNTEAYAAWAKLFDELVKMVAPIAHTD